MELEDISIILLIVIGCSMLIYPLFSQDELITDLITCQKYCEENNYSDEIIYDNQNQLKVY